MPKMNYFMVAAMYDLEAAIAALDIFFENPAKPKREGINGIFDPMSIEAKIVLFHALKTGNNNAVLQLLLLGVDPNIRDKNGDGILHHAARQGNSKLIELLFKHHIYFNLNLRNKAGNTPLMVAIDKPYALSDSMPELPSSYVKGRI